MSKLSLTYEICHIKFARVNGGITYKHAEKFLILFQGKESR
jgi:hypothetical protein